MACFAPPRIGSLVVVGRYRRFSSTIKGAPGEFEFDDSQPSRVSTDAHKNLIVSRRPPIVALSLTVAPIVRRL